MTLDSFELPATCNVRPVGAHEKREVVNHGDRTLHVITNTWTESQIPVVPLDVEDFKMLITMLDQGSIGTAGTAFSAFHLQKTIWGKFDKIHRLIRDCKNGEADCLDAVFSKTKLWSSYLVGMNNRPFNSGATSTLKERLLALFLIGGPDVTIKKDVFRKYACRMAREWNMPCHDSEDMKRILARAFV